MPIVGFRFRAYADRRTLRALKAQLRLRERRATPYVGQTRRVGAARGARGAPPTTHSRSYGQGGARKREVSPLRAG